MEETGTEEGGGFGWEEVEYRSDGLTITVVKRERGRREARIGQFWIFASRERVVLPTEKDRKEDQFSLSLTFVNSASRSAVREEKEQ